MTQEPTDMTVNWKLRGGLRFVGDKPRSFIDNLDCISTFTFKIQKKSFWTWNKQTN